MATATSVASKRVPIPRNGVDYRGKLVLAPMVRSGELPSRLLALHYGADLVWGPETVDRALIGTRRVENPVTKTIDFVRMSSRGQSVPPTPDADHHESVIYRLHPAREGRQLIYQIGTSNPETAVQAAKLIAADVAGIDVNAGCPKPFSTLGGMGAALLQTPDKLCAILRVLVAEVGTPHEIGISVKIRLLETADRTEALVRALCATGITGLTVHCRTTPMRPREAAIREQLRMIADTCREAGVACLMNGDVHNRDEAAQLMAEFGVDGAMIATAAETNPSVFRAAADGGPVAWDEVVRNYVATAMDVDNRWGNTKYLLGQMIPGKAPAYKEMTQTKCYTDLVRRLGYTDLEPVATETDRRLELGVFERPKMTKAEKKRANKEAARIAAGDAARPAQAAPTKSASRPLSPKAPKRKADAARLSPRPDQARSRAPGTVPENATVLAV